MANTKTTDVTTTPTDGNNLVPLVPTTTTTTADDVVVATNDVTTISDQGDTATISTATATATATAVPTVLATATATATATAPAIPAPSASTATATATTATATATATMATATATSPPRPTDDKDKKTEQYEVQQQQQQDMEKNKNKKKKNVGGPTTKRQISFATELVDINHYEEDEDEKKDTTIDPSPMSPSSQSSSSLSSPRTTTNMRTTGVFRSSSLRSQPHYQKKENRSSSSLPSYPEESSSARSPRAAPTNNNRTGVFRSSTIRSRQTRSSPRSFTKDVNRTSLQSVGYNSKRASPRASPRSLTKDLSMKSIQSVDSDFISADFNGNISSSSTRPEFHDPKQTESSELDLLEAYFETQRNEDTIEELAHKGMLHSALASMPDRERLPLAEDVYAFIIVCPVFSVPFWYAMYCIILKYIIYSILLSDIKNDDMYLDVGIDADTGAIIPADEWDGERNRDVQVVKFFLIPVAVAMQEDLMTVFANVANKEYDDTVMKYTKSATQAKFIASNILRLVDGFMSLGVNFYTMLMTNTILSVFLNFAALHFLQYIDDVFYDLVEQGFLGDSMEYVTNLCKQVTFKRRYTYHKDDNDDDDDYEMTQYEKWSKSITNLDTILMSATLLVCVIIYGFVQGYVYAGYLL